MKTKHQQTLARGGQQAYISPEIEVMDIELEGALCGDSNPGSAGYDGDDYDLGEI